MSKYPDKYDKVDEFLSDEKIKKIKNMHENLKKFDDKKTDPETASRIRDIIHGVSQGYILFDAHGNFIIKNEAYPIAISKACDEEIRAIALGEKNQAKSIQPTKEIKKGHKKRITMRKKIENWISEKMKKRDTNKRRRMSKRPGKKQNEDKNRFDDE